jgi:integrase/recombinase XerD
MRSYRLTSQSRYLGATACHLVLAGLDINTVRAWLGNVSISTTNIYAEIDLTLKATKRVLPACIPDAGRNWLVGYLW